MKTIRINKGSRRSPITGTVHTILSSYHKESTIFNKITRNDLGLAQTITNSIVSR